jgi:hypothetical protein
MQRVEGLAHEDGKFPFDLSTERFARGAVHSLGLHDPLERDFPEAVRWARSNWVQDWVQLARS